MFLVRGALHCRECAERLLSAPGERVAQSDVVAAVDPTLCAFCGLDNGGVDLPNLGGVPACMPCEQRMRERAFPPWVRASFFALLVLLAFSWWRGASYFEAGRALIRGERLAQSQRYAEASAELATVLRSAPDCKKAILLKMKSDFLAGDFRAGYAVLERNKGREYEASALMTEVQAIVSRVERALGKANDASESVKKKKLEEAARLLAEASQIYPESQELRSGARHAAGGAAFDRKDYALFLTTAQAEVKEHPQDAMAQASLASALAARYAETGEESLRQESEAALAQALKLASASTEDKAESEEYAERIRYRLRTREIIDKDEYDRRFRSK